MYLIQTVQTSWRPQLPLPKESEGSVDEPITDADMERFRQSATGGHHHHQSSKKDNNPLSSAQNASGASTSSKKWSFGRLFRKKKDIVTDSSSEEDRKAGFVPVAQKYSRGNNANSKSKSKSKSSSQRGSKSLGSGFDHIVVNPAASAAAQPSHSPAQHIENEFFLPVETVAPVEAYYQNQQQYLAQPAYTRSSNSLERRAAARAVQKPHSVQRLGPPEPGVHTSSEEEIISLNSSTFSKYRSDESIHSGGQGQSNGQSRRSRAARNERYYKRLSRDGEVSHGQVPVMYAPQPAQRWKTQPVPLSIYNGPPGGQAQLRQAAPVQNQRLRNTGSLQHVGPYVQWGQMQQQQLLQQQQQQPKNLQNSVNDAKRSISYDSHIHLQNVNGRLQTKPLPPPPPPRDPLRRVNVLPNGSSGDLRPTSYAFDQNGLPILPASGLSGRCVSDDKIWAGQTPHYQSAHSLNIQTHSQPAPPPSQQQQQQPQPTHSRRFITRAERDAQPSKKSLPNGIEFHYVADATPRSRKPIHMLEPQGGEHALSITEPPSSGILRTTKSGLPANTSKANASDFWKLLDGGSQRRCRDGERPYAETNAKPRSISSSRAGELRAYPIPMYSEVQKPKSRPQPAQQGIDEVDNVVCASLQIKSNHDNANNYVEIRNKDFSKSNSMPNQHQRRSGEIPNTPNKYEEYVAEKREQHHQKPIFNPPTPPQRKLSIPPAAANVPPIYFPRKKPANLEEAINELEAIYKSLGLSEEPEKKERIPTPSEFEKYALAHADEYDEEDSPAGEPDPVRDDVAYRNIKLANLQHKTAEKQPPFGIPIGPIVPAPQSDYLHVTPVVDKKAAPHTPDVVKDDLAVRALRKDPPGPKERFVYPCGSLQKKNRATRTQSANIYSLIQRDAAKPSGGDLLSYMELTKNIDRAGSMSDLLKDNTAADVPATLKLLQNLKEQEQHLVSPKKVPFRHPSQGGAICQLPEKLTSISKEDVHKAPVPLPRTSLTPEPSNVAGTQMEDALNKIAKEAQESSVKLTQELQELRKEALITASRPKINPEEEKLEKDLQEIEAVSEAAKRCGKMLLETLPDAGDDTAAAKPRKLHKEGKLIKAIDQVSEAANAVCEKILKDIVTTEPPVVVQEAVQVKSKPMLSTTTPASAEQALVMPNLIKKLDPIQSEQIEAIAKRCMRQLSELADEQPDYDNLRQQEAIVACNETSAAASREPIDNQVSTVAEVRGAPEHTQSPKKPPIEEIDKIMQECEAKVRAQSASQSAATDKAPPQQPPPKSQSQSLLSSGDDRTTAPSMNTSSCSSSNAAHTAATSSTTASSFSSSSDCLAKSSSPSASRRRQSSSITSFNPYSSSDYIKSPSSEYHAPSTDPIKTFSTTSYDVPSSSATPNITTNSTFSYSPSPPPPQPLTASDEATAQPAVRKSRERTASPSQYNSSEELEMIFGMAEKPKPRSQQTLQLQPEAAVVHQPPPPSAPAHGSGNVDADTSTTHASSVPLSSANHASSVAKPECAHLTTNPNFAAANANANANANACNCNCVVVVVAKPATNATCALNVDIVDVKVNVDVDVDVDVEATTTIDTTDTTTTTNTTFTTTSTSNATTTTTTNLAINLNANANNTPTNISSTSCKLAEKLSPNFNRIFASKINIIVDRATSDDGHGGASTQFDSLSSLEEENSSNPDSGNVSLADFPLAASANVCVQLQSACNSRFEVRNAARFVSVVSIDRSVEAEEKLAAESSPMPRMENETAALERTSSDSLDSSEDITEQYSSLLRCIDADEDANLDPNANVVVDELIEPSAHFSHSSSADSLGTPLRKPSIVYETPQLTLTISELKVNYELNVAAAAELEPQAAAPNEHVLAQITQCTAAVEQLSEALDQMPRRRPQPRAPPSCEDDPSAPHNWERPVVPRRPAALNMTSDWRNDNNNNDTNNANDDAKPSTSADSNVVSLFGELRPATANSLTTLEHVLMACSLGVLSPTDLYTLCLIIVGMITIIAIALF